ncbi:hypothetical protein HRR83_002522 [Exophiala dermatitidis]|nr:hypothetical protein HRR74_002599 [Exophiala dermatitidis]KAJ4525329.1 hypothetical protein HRR73_002058 [Exophiala dermatitidis]KAJ4569059.1 hypothetical protein HRR81_006717 [Exophiala dermatitidis]KAJ4603465.1 hypothetical protein HRR83_002522 [Exophiala dermatitidis]KAJ4604139.1 hypothetical protein HRR84_001217 [Exophiala dermatitidis]
MDLLTRLIAGSGTSPTKQRTNTPAERLATCKSICNALNQTWRNGSLEREDDVALAYTTKLLQRLETILQDESRRAAPHSCLRYVTSSQSYIIVTKLALSCRHVDILKSAAQLFHILINGEAEGLLDSKLFARSLLDLVWYATIGGRLIVEERLETDLVELLFEIATKIRLDPDILPAWFYPDREVPQGRNAADDPRKSQFPLFHVLVQYVHHDGSVGDFARTALLYLTETASKFRPLETWMIESDLAPQMASGLGALYSRLSRQSTHFISQTSTPPIVALSDAPQTAVSPAESPSDGQQDLKAFFSYLAFWQDTLSHCKSVEVSDTLLDHFQVLFVQQLLYPSLLESSDVEGGSTAAVITHLSRILLALDHFQLVDRILRYLLASPAALQESKEKSHRRQRMSVSRRKSIDHLKTLAEYADSPSPDLFNLLDLMEISLKSSHSETVSACLKLLSVLLQKQHYHVAVAPSLFKLEPAPNAAGRYGVDEFNSQLCRLFDELAAIATHEDMDGSYQAALLDAQTLLEQHSCYLTREPDTETSDRHMLSIGRNSRLYDALITLLQNFFANDTVTNLYLTESLISVAACEQIDLHSWLLPSQRGGSVEEDSADNTTFVLGELVEQVRQWRSQFPQWDDLIRERRLELLEEDRQSRQTKDAGSKKRGESPRSSNSPLPPRPSTPRGSRIITTEFGSIGSTLSKAGSPKDPAAERASSRSSFRRPLQPAEANVQGNDAAAQQQLSASSSLLKTQVTLMSLRPPEEASASLPLHAGRQQSPTPQLGLRVATVSNEDSGTVTPGGEGAQAIRTQASLSHILTNAIILQEFILEIAAVVQLRATFFDEVQFKAPTTE